MQTLSLQNIAPRIYKTKPNLGKTVKTIDAYESGVQELFFIKNPKFRPHSQESKPALQKFLKASPPKPCWIYFPEEKKLLKTLNEKDFFTLRTARNRDLITEKEQKKFREFSVGIAGLSVGSAILQNLVMSGGPKHIKIADFDALEHTNLNRIKAGVLDLNKNKCQIAAESVHKIDPFTKLSLYPQGLNKINLTSFLLGPKKLNLFIDEIDGFAVKIQSRMLCKKFKLPVLMATDLGDSVMLDVERFDQEPKRPIFHGRLKKFNFQQNLNKLTYQEWLNIANQVIGKKFLPSKMLKSLKQIGKTLPAVPQLGATANLAGSIITLAVRKIANHEKLASGRYIINLESFLKSPNSL